MRPGACWNGNLLTAHQGSWAVARSMSADSRNTTRVTGTPRAKFLFAAACALCFALTRPPAGGTRSATAGSTAPDVVTLRGEGARSRITVRGRIVDYTGKSIVISTSSGKGQLVYRASRVVDISTPQSKAHVAGLKDFALGRYAEAGRHFEEALQGENRSWVRREILAMLVRCSLNRGEYASAGSRFALLVASDPTSRHFKLIPLTWASRPTDAALYDQARSWLSEADNEVERLLAAAIVLRDPRFTAAAQETLDELARSTDWSIRNLATAQLWRLRLDAGNLSAGELRRWQRRIENMPQQLRGGPYYLLGQGHLQRQEYDRAAAALLWLPLVYDHDRHLAARACLEAAEALAALGRPREAMTMYKEVVERFDGTQFAHTASAVLRSTSAAGSGN